MLNLSDKDLDRLSQEAAQQHEPGDIVGPRSWEKLEARLDRDLGKVTPNPARGIRRLPYYYAPAVLVILGISYYLVKLNNRSQKGTSSGSPPLTMVQPAPAEPLKPTSFSPNPQSSDKSNSTPSASSNTVQYPGTAGAAGAAAKVPALPATPGAFRSSATSATPGASGTSITPGTSTSASRINSAVHRHNNLVRTTPNSSVTDHSSTAGATGTPTSHQAPVIPDETGTGYPSSAITTSSSGTAGSPRDLMFSKVRGPVRLAHTPAIDDSALRAFNLATIRQPIRKGGLHINRSLEFGLVGAPDFASVNSVAGNKAGSTFGITVDYQFANHWYIGSGLLFSRKIFAAAPQDYHVPPNYYRDNGMWMGGGPTVDYIKGRFNMLEIPLDLRYDFSTGSNTLFFASVGASSYLFANENCNYYYSFYNRPDTKGFTYTSDPNNLFASLNLSMGVETGISNSLSVLVAPYVKIPTRNIGFGQVQLNSFGIDFALRFAPVLSRRR
jgi:hypothetical protein